jgi:SAM-dependent methyltransferase/uncharacterized protein YbaR (Trm112 family)
MKNYPMIDNWYLDNLVCPRDKSRLRQVGNTLVSETGNSYPIVGGVPVMLLNNVQQTIELANNSLACPSTENHDIYFLDTLGISNAEKDSLRQLIGSKERIDDFLVDPVVQFLVGATNGMLYTGVIGNLAKYPIPDLRLPDGEQKYLLDIGCSWGRWSIASTYKNYLTVGIDPSLGAILTAQRTAKQLGLNIKYVVADARYLPFDSSVFDRVFSYSVIQHFSKENARIALKEVHRVLKSQGESLIQMPNRFGIRSLQHLIRRGFTEGKNFEVRYWDVKELHDCFTEIIGSSEVLIDGFFGLGIQKSDLSLLPFKYKVVVTLSELLRSISKVAPFLRYVADSVYVQSTKL